PLLIGAAYVLPELVTFSPVPVLVVLLAAIPAAGLLLTATLRRDTRSAGRWHLVGLGVAVGLGAIVPLLVYQIDYDIPLGFPNALVIVAASALLAIGARAWHATSATLPAREHPETATGGARVPATAVVVLALAAL